MVRLLLNKEYQQQKHAKVPQPQTCAGRNTAKKYCSWPHCFGLTTTESTSTSENTTIEGTLATLATIQAMLLPHNISVIVELLNYPPSEYIYFDGTHRCLFYILESVPGYSAHLKCSLAHNFCKMSLSVNS